MKKFFLLFVVSILLTPLAMSQAKYPDWVNATIKYFPFSAVGGGTDYVNETRLQNGYELVATFKNPSDVSQQLRLDFFDDNGQWTHVNGQDSGATKLQNPFIAMVVPQAGHSARQITYTLPEENVKLGWIEITIPHAPEGQPEMSVSLRYQRKVNGQVMGQATVDPMQPMKSFSFPARSYRDPNQDLSETGLALTNPGVCNRVMVECKPELPANITITRRNGLGRVIDSFNVTIPAGGQSVRFLNQMKPLPMAMFDGLIEITSDVPIVGTAMQTTGDGESFNFSTIPISVP